MLVNMMAEEVQLCNTEQALVGVDDDPMRGESGENCSQVIKVLFWGGAGNENVVNVGVSHWNSTEDLIYETLKHLSSVAESKWHLDRFKKSKWGGYSSLGNVGRGHWDLVVGPD